MRTIELTPNAFLAVCPGCKVCIEFTQEEAKTASDGTRTFWVLNCPKCSTCTFLTGQQVMMT